MSQGDGLITSSLANRATFTRSLMDRYEKMLLRGQGSAGEFWDLVVLSAGDQKQRQSYLNQLERRPELSVLCAFRVVADPGGSRVGDGGSTMHILEQLDLEFGPSKLETMRTLVIHAGGYSKRLPSHSCTSKIFSALPTGLPAHGSRRTSPYQMLDMKLLMYLPFLSLMSGGDVFFTASDDLESFNLKETDRLCVASQLQEWRRSNRGTPMLCSLSHPSTLAVGTGHGVFRFSERDKASLTSNLNARLLVGCEEVLQKPTEAKMLEKRMEVSTGGGGMAVYTDSAYWINHALTKSILSLYERAKPVTEETSIYSDFMTCQGRSEEREHLKKLECGAESDLKTKIAAVMAPVPLLVLALPESKFYHVGTMSEYLDAFCSDEQLAKEFHFSRSASSSALLQQETKDEDSLPRIVASKAAVPLSASPCSKVRGCVLASTLPSADFSIPERSVVEFSYIPSNRLTLEPETILSGVRIGVNPALSGSVPGGRVYHTAHVRVSRQSGTKFVTVAFAVDDDLKKGYESPGDVVWCGRKLGDLHQDPATLFPDAGGGPFSLWLARLFALSDTMEGSFQETLDCIRAIKEGRSVEWQCSCDKKGPSWLNMAEVLEHKDDEAMMNFRNRVE